MVEGLLKDKEALSGRLEAMAGKVKDKDAGLEKLK